MKKIVQEVLEIIYNYGYEAYAVGGYVRDMLLNIKSNDVDLTTNATPMELKNIFETITIKKENYGSVRLVYKNIRFEITTYRRETNYSDNRHPDKIEYVNDLKIDLLRRDFTINAICMDRNGNIIDLLNGINDLENGFIRTIIDSSKAFNDDSLRILRAIRFATTLDFKLSDEIIEAIKINRHLLKKLSYTRKKSELNHIFASSHAKEGIDLLKKFDLIEILELQNISKLKDYSDINLIWAIINSSVYPFTNSEKELIKKINDVYKLNNFDKEVLYQYGLYVNVLAGLNKGLDKKQITEIYQKLPIHTRDDINIDALKICSVLERKPDYLINEILKDLEKKILNGNLINEEKEIITYIERKYKVTVK